MTSTPSSSWLQPSPSLTFTPTDNYRHLLPRVTPAPSFACCQNQVVIELHTTLLISDYSKYYDRPISQFQPSYTSLAEGSLITQALISDLHKSYCNVLVLGILLMFFIRNLFVSGDYIKRAKVRTKVLFYVLFVSQLAASASVIPMVISIFQDSVNCRAAYLVSTLFCGVSLGLLVIWILGYKAYKCLNNSRFVLGSLFLLFCSSSAFVGLEMFYLSAERSLTGSCRRTDDLRYTRLYIAVQLLESVFICCCFSYALWKSRNSPIARGRISVQLSMDDAIPDDHCDDNTEKEPRMRGWWDYVPQKESVTPEAPKSPPASGSGLFATLFSKVTEFVGRGDTSSARPTRKPSVAGDFPIPQPPRPSTVRISEPLQSRPPSNPTFETWNNLGRTSPSPPSINSRLSRLIPRMELFRDVMRDELCYTTFITASCVVVAVLAIIGVNFKNGLSVTAWTALNWAIISFLAIHSFGRVVRRHERDAVLQEPGTWQLTGSGRVTRQPASARQGKRRQLNSPPLNSTSIRRVRRMISNNGLDDQANPFSDTCALNQRESTNSWNSGYTTSSYDIISSPGAKEKSYLDNRRSPVPLPSLFIEELPASGRTTPVAFHGSSDGTLVQGFRQSWPYASSSASPVSSGDDEKSVLPRVS